MCTGTDEELAPLDSCPQAENVEGGDALVRIFDAVVDGSTASLNLQAIDFSASPGDLVRARERESSTRRKTQQCLYLRGVSTVFRALIAPQIATAGYRPRFAPTVVGVDVGGTSDGGAGASVSSVAESAAANAVQYFTQVKPKETKTGKAAPIRVGRGRRMPVTSSPRRRPLHLSSASKEELSDIAATPVVFTAPDVHAVPAALVSTPAPPQPSLPQLPQDSSTPFKFEVDLPSIWQTYLRAFFRQQRDKEPASLKLTKANVKTLILDICLEFLKADHLQLDNCSLWTIAPFVCDYFILRYESPALIGCWLFSFVEGLLAFPSDPRIAFFRTASGLPSAVSGAPSPSYDVFLYYLHALGHVFFGQMKIFKAENRLEESRGGSCPVPSKHIASTADLLFEFTLTSSEKHLLHQEIDALPAAAHGKWTPSAFETASTVTSGALSLSNDFDSSDPAEKTVELDDAMELFLSRWDAMNEQVDNVRLLLRAKPPGRRGSNSPRSKRAPVVCPPVCSCACTAIQTCVRAPRHRQQSHRARTVCQDCDECHQQPHLCTGVSACVWRRRSRVPGLRDSAARDSRILSAAFQRTPARSALPGAGAAGAPALGRADKHLVCGEGKKLLGGSPLIRPS